MKKGLIKKLVGVEHFSGGGGGGAFSNCLYVFKMWGKNVANFLIFSTKINKINNLSGQDCHYL